MNPLQIQLDNPLTETEINSARESEKIRFNQSKSKIRKTGLVIILSSIAWMIFAKYALQVESRSSAENFFLLVFIVGMALGINIFFLPRLFVIFNFESYYYVDYLPAHPSTLHNCKAFLNMPGMEAHKEYAEKVAQQGRKLTHQECQVIIEHWNSLNQE